MSKIILSFFIGEEMQASISLKRPFARQEQDKGKQKKLNQCKAWKREFSPSAENMLDNKRVKTP
jgi:hypothetical protein